MIRFLASFTKILKVTALAILVISGIGFVNQKMGLGYYNSVILSVFSEPFVHQLSKDISIKPPKRWAVEFVETEYESKALYGVLNQRRQLSAETKYQNYLNVSFISRDKKRLNIKIISKSQTPTYSQLLLWEPLPIFALYKGQVWYRRNINGRYDIYFPQLQLMVDTADYKIVPNFIHFL